MRTNSTSLCFYSSHKYRNTLKVHAGFHLVLVQDDGLKYSGIRTVKSLLYGRQSDRFTHFHSWKQLQKMPFSSTEVPENTKNSSLSYCITLRECNFFSYMRRNKKNRKKRSCRYTHLFLMQLKTRYKLEWHQKVFHIRRKKKKNFSHWNLYGWMDEYKNSQRTQVTCVFENMRLSRLG